MPEIVVTNRNGDLSTVAFTPGLTLMQTLCEAGFTELLALCGGVCSCATCHVYVDPAWIAKTGAASSDMEKSMLEFAEEVRDNSRLACQISITDDLDGLVLKLPEKQH